MHGTRLKFKIPDSDPADHADDDLGELIASIKAVGLRHPVVVDVDYRVISGHRRIKAARALGWTQIDALVFDITKIIKADHRAQRRSFNFTVADALAVARHLEPLHRARVADQISVREAYKAASRIAKKNGSAAPARNFKFAGTHQETIGPMVGMSPANFFKARAVAEAARTNPNAFGDLLRMIDDTQIVTPAYALLRRRRRGEPTERYARREGVQRKTRSRTSTKRHRTFKKMLHLNRNREVQRAVWALDGICEVLTSVPVDELDPTQIESWSLALRESGALILRTAKRIANHAEGTVCCNPDDERLEVSDGRRG